LAARGPIDEAKAHTCTVVGSTVTLTSGSRAIVANTTLNGTPAVNGRIEHQR
jgi:hypothetical protein